MPTESFQLTRERWTRISEGPCFVENTSTYLRFAVRAASEEPTDWETPFHIVNPEEEFEHEDSEPLFARALSDQAKAIVTSDAGQWDEGDAIFVSRAAEGDLTAAVWSLIVSRAQQQKTRIVFDKDMTLATELVVRAPVHIVVPLGVTVALSASAVLDKGVVATDSSAYHSGLFVYRPGSEGSILEVNGKLSCGNTLGLTGKGAPATMSGVAIVGLLFDHSKKPAANVVHFAGRPVIEAAHMPCVVFQTPVVGLPWDIAGFYTPMGAWSDADL